MPEVVAVTTRRQLAQFIDLPYELYAQVPQFVPQLRRDERRRFDRRHNPFFEHGDIRPLLAIDGGQVVGRIAAIDNRLHDQVHDERATWFGFFEARDATAARALLDAVIDHARQRGSQVVRGPVNPSLHDSCGLLVDGFADPPAALMPYNPPSYGEFIERAGFRKAKDLFAWDIDVTRPLDARIERVAERLRHRSGIVVRPVDLKRFDVELAILKTVYRAAWADNWGFVPPTDAEIDELAVELRPIVESELVLFAEIAGRPVGCAVTIPDVNQVLKQMNGRLFPFGVLHFLRRRSVITRVRMLLLGVLPEVRRLGVYPLLMAEARRRAAALGYRQGEVGWTLEDNDAINTGIAAGGGRRSKTYRLYEQRLD
jgi:GNAT superfamily N-acetyltransferase